MVAIVIVLVLVFFTVTGCGIGNVDSDRISQANQAALQFLGEERADLAFVGTSEYCGMRSLEFEISEVVAISVDEENRISGYKRLDLPNEGKVVITGEDARRVAETFVRQNYHGFENREMLLYRDYCGQVGLEGFDFDWDGNIEFAWTELKYGLGTPNVAKVTVNAFSGAIEAYEAIYHIQVPDIEVSKEDARELAVARVKPRAEARHTELRFDYLPWSLNKEPRINPYWKVTLQLTGRDGSGQSMDVNIDAVTGEQRKTVGKFPYFQ